jgi:hypothetical protein
MVIPLVALIALIAIIIFIISFAGKKKNKGESMGEKGKTMN